MTALATSVRAVAPVEAILGEGPLYDPRSGRLLFLDIRGGALFAYDPSTEKVRRYAAPGAISALGLRRKGGYVCARKEGFAFLTLAGDAAEAYPLCNPEASATGNRFNDGKVDLSGGFWAGTMDEKERDTTAGSWWRLGADRAVRKLDKGFHVTNGPAFDAARGRVYFTDSARQTIFSARAEADGFSGKSVFLRFKDGDGYPDGMDVDADGCLWVAFWDGAAVRRFSPEGALLGEIAIPARRPTSLALVGDRAFVTSARGGLTPEELATRPLSGALFEIVLSRDLSAPPRYFEG